MSKEKTEQPQQRAVVPGYERICEICPFKDNYIASKQVGGFLQQIDTLKSELDKLQKKKDKLKEESEDE